MSLTLTPAPSFISISMKLILVLVNATAIRDAVLPQESLASTSARSEEHTSELQSPCNLVCRLLLEKKSIRNVRVGLRMRRGVNVGYAIVGGRGDVRAPDLCLFGPVSGPPFRRAHIQSLRCPPVGLPS